MPPSFAMLDERARSAVRSYGSRQPAQRTLQGRPLDKGSRQVTSRMKRIVSFTPALALMAAALLAVSAEAQDVASFKLTARDGVFDPAVIEVTAGKRFRIEIVN